MKAIYLHKSICSCGFSMLADEVPLGTVYDVHPEDTELLDLGCGGCFRITRNIPCILVEPRNGKGHSGYLPAAIFEMDEGAAA